MKALFYANLVLIDQRTHFDKFIVELNSFIIQFVWDLWKSQVTNVGTH